ncbi:hypothetical protein JABBAWOKKIE_35 [Mycobacterium phage Jabbawokkie]|uniref:Uncharacterized protein n=1 Tax=Mycobacterium phage Zapner TaxID=1486474 RepID=A0A059VL03_9CAUD|nr:hypothetical protein N850_gp034 [Mycobacterium phage Jabbawokkie]YP_009963951.1 hypothetical protein I5I04_gp034 [Mycobacterium phage Zapner]AGT12134.1 hypothetical protein JABBAWOKKIE_35 [Mycobacterium phage Jabbawokkie]AHZ95488.1 hypothetical protein PBI_ZAPNER_34 [Mycobacterium phage Zapner]
MKQAITAIGTGLLGGAVLTGLLSWMFATGCPLVDHFIENDTLFYI